MTVSSQPVDIDASGSSSLASSYVCQANSISSKNAGTFKGITQLGSVLRMNAMSYDSDEYARPEHIALQRLHTAVHVLITAVVGTARTAVARRGP